VKFKNLVNEREFFDQDNKGSSLDFLNDLNVFESSKQKNQTLSKLRFAYKESYLDYIKSEARGINQRFLECSLKQQKVQVNEENMYNSLFTFCYFASNDKSSENTRRKGVLLQIKFDSYHKRYMLLFRNIQTIQSQKEKFEWVPLTKQEVEDPAAPATAIAAQKAEKPN
jgi:hypothetical protein